LKNIDIFTSLDSTDDIIGDIKRIVEVSQKEAYRSINIILIARNWFLGKRIVEEEIKNRTRSEYYGQEIIQNLSKILTDEYGKGFTKSNLYGCCAFYTRYPEIFQSLTGKSPKILSWTHYLILLRVDDEKARKWYHDEAFNQGWSVRTLKRNVETQYYYRLMSSGMKKPVIDEMHEKTMKSEPDRLEFIKNPVVVEFLGLSRDASFTETKLESSIISNLQKFLMELGKGYAFVARQQHIHTEKEDYYIDLVFYNYLLKCFVLIDLKTGKITHQDVGQMDMYVRMYDEMKKGSDDNPTLGIVLCSETDEDIARYSILHGNEQLFASKYKLYLPTEEQLRLEIQSQKTLFTLQHPDSEE